MMELVVDGATVAGTLTKDGADAAAVTGQLKSSYNGKSLSLETKAGDESFTVVLDGERLHGTYVFNGGSPEKSFKTGVVLKRPSQPTR
jgi:hypothetical protein